jgi:hypothetical protein
MSRGEHTVPSFWPHSRVEVFDVRAKAGHFRLLMLHRLTHPLEYLTKGIEPAGRMYVSQPRNGFGCRTPAYCALCSLFLPRNPKFPGVASHGVLPTEFSCSLQLVVCGGEGGVSASPEGQRFLATGSAKPQPPPPHTHTHTARRLNWTEAISRA